MRKTLPLILAATFATGCVFPKTDIRIRVPQVTEETSSRGAIRGAMITHYIQPEIPGPPERKLAGEDGPTYNPRI